MARPAGSRNKVRLTIEVAKAVRERMDDLRARTGAESVTEVIRRALALYDLVVGAAHVRIVVRKKNGEVETMIVPSAIV